MSKAKLEIEYMQIARVINFLDELSFKGIRSINRTKITRYLASRLQEIADGEKVIREDFKDDPRRMGEELSEYFQQTIVVEGAEYEKPIEHIAEKVKELTAEDSDAEFSGNDAYALSVLYGELVEGDSDEK